MYVAWASCANRELGWLAQRRLSRRRHYGHAAWRPLHEPSEVRRLPALVSE